MSNESQYSKKPMSMQAALIWITVIICATTQLNQCSFKLKMAEPSSDTKSESK